MAMQKVRFPLEINVQSAYPMENGSARTFANNVCIKDIRAGAMTINGYDFHTALFGDGLNIMVSGGDTADPALYINGELVMEGCGISPVLETVMEILKLECATQNEYPS